MIRTLPLKSPRTSALAYRIEYFGRTNGWNVTASEIADALDADVRSVASICNHMGWNHRMPGVSIGIGEYNDRGRAGMGLELLTGEIPSVTLHEIVEGF